MKLESRRRRNKLKCRWRDLDNDLFNFFSRIFSPTLDLGRFGFSCIIVKISNTFMVQLTHRWIKKSECLEGLFKLLLYPLVKMSFSVVTGEFFFSVSHASERIFFRYSTVNKCTLNWMIMALLLKLFYKWAATWNNYCWLFFFVRRH